MSSSSLSHSQGDKANDKHVTVIETSSGTRLTGEDGPLHSELEQWLKDHPGYAVCVWVGGELDAVMWVIDVVLWLVDCRYEVVESDEEQGYESGEAESAVCE